MPNTGLSLPPAMSRLAVAAGGWPRRALAALLLLAGAVLLAAPQARSTAAPADVVVAATRLPAGATLTSRDLRTARWPAALVPDGALRVVGDAVGKTVAGPVSGGEALTENRLLDTAISAALSPGQVAVSVTLRDPAQTAILQAGARVDLYVTPPTGSADPDPPANPGTPIAADVAILAVLAPSTAGSARDTSSVVIACAQATAARIARVASGTFTASLRPS